MQPPATITTTQNYPQLPTKPPTTIYIHPEITQKRQDLSQTVMLILKQALSFDSYTKRWYIYLCVSVCIYFTSHYYIDYLLLRLVVCFCQH